MRSRPLMIQALAILNFNNAEEYWDFGRRAVLSMHFEAT